MVSDTAEWVLATQWVFCNTLLLKPVMKKDIYAVIVIILKLVWWLLLQKLSEFYQFWKNLLSLRQFYANMEASANPLDKMYNFRPYELTKVDYKCYKGLFDKGINTYPKPRSGHRIVCNDSDLFCFGGFNPDIVTERNRAPRPAATTQLFQELWRFDTFTLKWRLLLVPSDGNVMPLQFAASAVCMKEDMIIVSCFIPHIMEILMINCFLLRFMGERAFMHASINAFYFGPIKSRERFRCWKRRALSQRHSTASLRYCVEDIYMWSVEPLDLNIHVIYTGKDGIIMIQTKFSTTFCLRSQVRLN